MSDICKCHLQLDFCRIPLCREILEQKHAATTAAITNEETEILEQFKAVTVECKEETIDSKDQELLALIERRKKHGQKRQGPSERHQQEDQSNRVSETTKDPKDMRKYMIFLKNSVD